MLMPKKVRHRKHHRGRTKGVAKGGTTVSFGDYGIQALEPGWITAPQIEAARVAMTRHVRRGRNVARQQDGIALPVGQHTGGVKFEVETTQIVGPGAGLHDQNRFTAGAFKHGGVFANGTGVAVAEEGVGVAADYNVHAADLLRDLDVRFIANVRQQDDLVDARGGEAIDRVLGHCGKVMLEYEFRAG